MKDTKGTTIISDVVPTKEGEPAKKKKKRGRKKKIKTPEEIEREKNYKPKRRGRKPKNLINNINEKNSKLILENTSKDETIILNLKLDDKDNKDDKDDKDGNIPVGFDNITTFESLPSKITSGKCFGNLKTTSNNDNIPEYNDDIRVLERTIINSDINIKENLINSDEKKWQTNTSIKCYWCCHSFNNTPFGIPIKYKNGKFYVNGIFCSLECAATYNFSEEKGIQDIWESYNLLNLLSHKINYKNIVRLAPKRTCLNMFGGVMNIEEFRNFSNENKIINILEYPMISASQQIEEINYDNNSNQNNFIPIDEERIKKLEQKIKLMRRAPLLNHKNTLEHTMNIKISND